MNDPVGIFLLLFLKKDLLLSACFCHKPFPIFDCRLPIFTLPACPKSTIDNRKSTMPLTSCPAPSSSRWWRGADPYECERWCAYAVRERAANGDAAVHDSSRCPSGA